MLVENRVSFVHPGIPQSQPGCGGRPRKGWMEKFERNAGCEARVRRKGDLVQALERPHDINSTEAELAGVVGIL
jgi:hypothetical protein